MKPEQSKQLHPRNKHNAPYDFDVLTRVVPALKSWITKSPRGQLTIPFSEPEAVTLLNTALLAHHYGVKQWSIPKGNLCPPIPGRADYIHYIADLLNSSGLSSQAGVLGMDIGVGANCIYPLIGVAEYGWHFIGTDIQETSLANANRVLSANPKWNKAITLRKQPDSKAYFSNIIDAKDKFAFTMCNPPFHRSAKDAAQGSRRKTTNLARNQHKRGQRASERKALNFGGNANELWCEGGELRFITDMIKESANYRNNVLWFTCLVSKSENLRPIKKQLKGVEVASLKTVEMIQGNKTTRFIAWSFVDLNKHADWLSA